MATADHGLKPWPCKTVFSAPCDQELHPATTAGWWPALQCRYLRPFYGLSDFFRQDLPLDLHGRRAGKILFPDQVSGDTFEIRQLAIAAGDVVAQSGVEFL